MRSKRLVVTGASRPKRSTCGSGSPRGTGSWSGALKEAAVIDPRGRDQVAHSRTRHSGGTSVGMMLGSGLMMASTGGGRSTTTTEISEDAVVEVRVQRERNGPMSCHAFAFGKDVSGAETVAATINRLIDARVE